MNELANGGTNAKPQVMNLHQYIESEKEKSDLFKFMRVFCPFLYNKYVRVSQTSSSASGDQEELK